MCLIVHKPADKVVPFDIIDAAFRNNSDGFGIMAAAGNGRVEVRKILPTTTDECVRLYDEYAKRELGLHWRMRTHGAIDIAQCHPYQVLNYEDHGRDVWLMHNGVMSDVPCYDKNKSDTAHFVELMLKPMLLTFEDALESAQFKEWIGSVIGAGNKLLVLDGKTG